MRPLREEYSDRGPQSSSHGLLDQTQEILPIGEAKESDQTLRMKGRPKLRAKSMLPPIGINCPITLQGGSFDVTGPNLPARIAPPEHWNVYIRITLDVVALERHQKARGPRNRKGKVEKGGKVLKQPQMKLIGKDLNSLQLQDSQIGMYLSHR